MTILTAPLSVLEGVGEKRCSTLAGAGYETIDDLIRLSPIRWEDRRSITTIARIDGVSARSVGLAGEVVRARPRRTRRRRFSIFEATLDDGTGRIELVWFNQPWLEERLSKGVRIVIFGTPVVGRDMQVVIENPAWHLEQELGGQAAGIVAHYGSIGAIRPATVGSLVRQALDRLDQNEDTLPETIREALGVEPLSRVATALHAPDDLDQGRPVEEKIIRRRFVLEEFLSFQLALLSKRPVESTTESESIAAAGLVGELIGSLPFELTAAQRRALDEITRDLTEPRPMYRLLQGDVGSGKTIVALIAAATVARSGRQTALAAPTQILAEQLWDRARAFLEPLGIEVALLTGGTGGSRRRRISRRSRDGGLDVLVGTHALFQEEIGFDDLGLVIIDEQHRFGVAQRRALVRKGRAPNVLVMSATPIPRSLAIASFADLELSSIDELPRGRKPVRTELRTPDRIPAIHDFIDRELEQGGQAFVVFPLVETSEKIDARSVSDQIESLRRRFANRRVEALHGRMTAEQKEEIMRRFAAGEIDLLATTTIIEVGVDVPNASVILIHHADRLGLSQLHQLRGRVGRGSRPGWCILLRESGCSDAAVRRLRKLAETNDGFEVARLDLQTRGFGEVFGTRQHGAPRFRHGDPIDDAELMEEARAVALTILEQEGTARCRELAETLLGARMLRETARD